MIKNLFGGLLILFISTPALAAPSLQDSMVEWLNANAIPLETDDPEQDGSDIAAAAALIGDASLIGAGEATHGTREFFRLKDRLFRELVRNHGVRGFAIEANYADAEAINRYIQGGPGDTESLLAGLGFWTWDTEEVAALIDWMRAFNESRSDPIVFYGFDIQYAPTNLNMAFDYLDAVDADTRQWRSVFEPYLKAATDIRSGYRATNSYSRETMANLRDQSASIVHYLDRNRHILVARSNDSAYLQAKGAAVAAAWYFVMQSRPEDWRFTGFQMEYDVRDRAMADLALIAKDRLAATQPMTEPRVYLWAHNAHIAKTRHRDDRMTMGLYLSQDAPAEYVSIGFGFDRGGFQAFPPADPDRPDYKPNLQEMILPPAPPNYAGATLRQAQSSMWIADLRRAEPGSGAHGWLSQAYPWRWTGALYSDELEAKHPPINILTSHDLLIFVGKTNRARPLANTINRLGLKRDW